MLNSRRQAYTYHQDSIRVSGRFRPNGATGIVAGSEVGKGWSVARSGEGVYLITFSQPYANLISYKFGVRVADATPTIVQGGDYSATAGTLQVRVLQESTGTLAVADMSADVDNEVSFEVEFGVGSSI